MDSNTQTDEWLAACVLLILMAVPMAFPLACAVDELSKPQEKVGGLVRPLVPVCSVVVLPSVRVT